MNPAIEAQARIRRNAEEESNALNDFSVWETTIKQNDAKIKKAAQSSKIRSSTLLGKCDNRVFENESFSKVNSEISTPVLAGRSNSIVIGGQQQVVQSKNPVARAPKEAIENDNPAISEDALEENERQLGNTLFSSRDYQGSIKHYTKSIQLNPSSMLSYSNRGEKYHDDLSYFLNTEQQRLSFILYLHS
jgi:tetratricopeptide (TPR) repeat protein